MNKYLLTLSSLVLSLGVTHAAEGVLRVTFSPEESESGTGFVGGKSFVDEASTLFSPRRPRGEGGSEIQPAVTGAGIFVITIPAAPSTAQAKETLPNSDAGGSSSSSLSDKGVLFSTIARGSDGTPDDIDSTAEPTERNSGEFSRAHTDEVGSH